MNIIKWYELTYVHYPIDWYTMHIYQKKKIYVWSSFEKLLRAINSKVSENVSKDINKYQRGYVHLSMTLYIINISDELTCIQLSCDYRQAI